MNQEKIGKFICELRKSKNMTQQDLADKLGVSDRTVGNWERGRNMPDLSLFKPLCELLGISVNDLINGEVVKESELDKVSEDNLINTLNYSKKQISKKENILSIILIAFGVLIVLIAMSLFASDSSWGSVYSIFGVLISFIGVCRLTKKISKKKRLLIDILYILLFITVLFVIDYFGVIHLNQAPRFSFIKVNGVYFNTPFYDVIRCDEDTKYESYNVVGNMYYDMDKVNNYCFNKKEERFNKLIDYALEHADLITVGMMVDSVDSDSTYFYSTDRKLYEIIKRINELKEVHEIINIVKKSKYELNSNLIGYTTLFQVYEGDKLLFEFDRGTIKTEDDSIMVYFLDSDAELLKSYYK